MRTFKSIFKQAGIGKTGIFWLFAMLGCSSAFAQSKPNIVMIIVDQWRADASKLNGFALNTTPFLDSLATNGTWFNKAYCASPACVPSRTSLMTGRFPSATHVRSNMNLEDAYFKTDLIDVVKAQGYSTALIGKNHSYLKPADFDFWKGYFHLGVDTPEGADEKAFNDYMKTTNYYMDAKPAPFPAEMQLPSRIVNDSEKWISDTKSSDKPFFLYMSIPEPHNPYQVSEPYYSMFPPESLPPLRTGADVLPSKGNKWVLQQEMLEMGYPGFEKNIPRIRSNYYGMLRLIDDQLKGFVSYLKANNLYDNTILIFIADHGDFTGEYGLIKKGVEVPESLTRIPMIWHGPGIVENKKPHMAHVSNVDIMPTLCDMLNVPLPEGVQGRSMWPLLTGKEYPKEEFASMIVQQGFGGLHYTDLKEYNPYTQDGTLTKGKIEFDELNTWTQSGTMRMLRKGDWKLVYDMQGSGQMYNLAKDPSEVKNLYDDKLYRDKQMELLQALMTWELRNQDPLPLPHPNKVRTYGFKTDPRNYYAPYKDEPERKLKANIEAAKEAKKANSKKQ
ncbi:MAG: sulfatase [Sphingobacteriaceae bacterium]|jgi:arylsulfatase A-like enzyme|nr:sulfatase [Sphingobacteriaceae bacterium]